MLVQKFEQVQIMGKEFNELLTEINETIARPYMTTETVAKN